MIAVKFPSRLILNREAPDLLKPVGRLLEVRLKKSAFLGIVDLVVGRS